MDRLDEMNRKNSMHSNLIKWWNVNMISSDSDDNNNSADELLDLTVLDEDSKNLAEKILVENSNVNAYDKAYNSLELDEYNKKQDEANEIYERLMREAAEDEAKKQQEIEMARLMAEQ